MYENDQYGVKVDLCRALDLYLGGKNKLILSSYGSSYCEMQWWFGGGKSKVEVMILK